MNSGNLVGNVSIDNTDRFVTDADEFLTKAQEYQATVGGSGNGGFYDDVDNLKNAWKGEAAERRIGELESFKEDFMKVSELLSQYCDGLKEKAHYYKKLESEL